MEFVNVLGVVAVLVVVALVAVLVIWIVSRKETTPPTTTPPVLPVPPAVPPADQSPWVADLEALREEAVDLGRELTVLIAQQRNERMEQRVVRTNNALPIPRRTRSPAP